MGQGQDRGAVRAVAVRADGDGAEPARPFHAFQSALRDAQHRVPCAAAVARRLRRAAARLSGGDGVGLQSAGRTAKGTVRLASADFRDAPVIAPNYLSDAEDRDVAVEFDQAGPQADGDKAHGGLQADRGEAGRGRPERRGTGARRRAASPPRSSIRSAPRRWAGRRQDGGGRSKTCACAVSAG